MLELRQQTKNVVPDRRPAGRRPPARRRARDGLVCLGLLLVAACVGLARPLPTPAALPGWAATLHDVAPAALRALPKPGEPLPLPTDCGVLLVDPSWRPGAPDLDEAQLTALRAWVQAGGHLVLFGHAARLVVDLQFESERPVCRAFRWGYDPRAVAGRAQLSLVGVAGQFADWFAGGAADARLALTGGQPCTLPLCTWQNGDPRNGAVLARLGVETDGQREPFGAPALVHYRAGRGAVLACGLVPAVDDADPELRAAAAEFVRRCAVWAGGERTEVWRFPPRTAPAIADVDLSANLPLLPHWGWQSPGPAAASERSASELRDQVLLPSWSAGADLVEVLLTAHDGTAAEPWPADDPLRPAPSWRNPAADAAWAPGAVAELAAEAHARGLLALGAFEPLPVGEVASERLVALRYAARQWADRRRLGAGALDGFAVQEWFADDRGYGLGMLQDFQPAAVLQRRGERVGELAGAVRALDASDGALATLPLPGLGSGWRDGYPGDLFPFGVLEARSFGNPEDPACGASVDWLVQQGNDFVRARLGRGAALSWRRYEPERFAADTSLAVHGWSLESLRAAMAMPLSATGSNGLRAAAASLLPEPPPGFGASCAEPAAVHVLQNNHLRLAGSGGELQLDPRGTARFTDGAAVRLSPSFLRTRLLGARPDGSTAATPPLDFLQRGLRGEGDHPREVRVGSTAEAPRPPGVLAFAEAGRWPCTAVFAWPASVGYHELELGLRGVRGHGVVAVSLDGVLLQAVPFHDDRAEPPLVVPLHSVRAGERLLRLEVRHGGAVALDRLVVRRVGDVAVEASVGVVGGCRAELVEQSASSQHQERLELIGQADLPGFVLRGRCDAAARGLQIERTFSLPDRTLASPDAEPEALRGGFVLRSTTGQGDLVVVPLRLARNDKLRWRDGVLQLLSAPEPGLQFRIGFLCCPAGTGAERLAAAAVELAALDTPRELELAADGSALLLSELPTPWSEVVHFAADPHTPFAVREGSLWSWRGSQAAPDGGRWLRVHHTPGGSVQVVGGPALLATTRPGPGSAGLLQLEEPRASSVTVHVRQQSRLAVPSVVMGSPFDAVLVDGEPWAHFDGSTVFLPAGVGRRTVRTQSLAGVRAPHVRSTAAPLSVCRYVPERRELLLVTPGDPHRPVELPWTAVLGGPVPVRIENGELVDEATLRHRDAALGKQARAGGVLIRFRSGITKVFYGD